MRCVNSDSLSLHSPLELMERATGEDGPLLTPWDPSSHIKNSSFSYCLWRRLCAWQQITSQPPLNIGNNSFAKDTEGQVLAGSKEPR